MPHDCNVLIATLIKTMEAHLSRHDRTPEVLYIQLDNATGTNKNKWVLFFLGLLVGWKHFRKVKVSFLLVGHTHEDIDQMFSRFAEYLRKTGAFSIAHLCVRRFALTATLLRSPTSVTCTTSRPGWIRWPRDEVPHRATMLQACA